MDNNSHSDSGIGHTFVLRLARGSALPAIYNNSVHMSERSAEGTEKKTSVFRFTPETESGRRCDLHRDQVEEHAKAFDQVIRDGLGSREVGRKLGESPGEIGLGYSTQIFVVRSQGDVQVWKTHLRYEEVLEAMSHFGIDESSMGAYITDDPIMSDTNGSHYQEVQSNGALRSDRYLVVTVCDEDAVFVNGNR